ncbi:MAG: hypothetical protein H0X64_15280 [Gemmatimonadaceae bacterium]|nr:hypothetical protein [Gemmatimonadaceae bacterium]
MSRPSGIVAFHDGTGTDHRGRTLAEIQAFSHDDLEAHHDFIQWLFPLREQSPVNPAAPTLDDATIRAFHARPELRAALRRSFDVMLRFYGFDLRETEGGVAIAPGAGWEAAARNWLTPGNHNFLRITRILHSLTLLGHREAAVVFLAALEEVHAAHGGVIGPVTIGYWRRAIDATDNHTRRHPADRT